MLFEPLLTFWGKGSRCRERSALKPMLGIGAPGVNIQIDLYGARPEISHGGAAVFPFALCG